MKSWQEIILAWRIGMAEIQIFAVHPGWRKEAFDLLKDNLKRPGVLEVLNKQLQREPRDSPLYSKIYNVLQGLAG